MAARLQGGTCVMVGDEHAKVTEAAKAAERHLKCSIFRASPFWRKDGFSQDMHAKEARAWPCSGYMLEAGLSVLFHAKPPPRPLMQPKIKKIFLNIMLISSSNNNSNRYQMLDYK
jgi:hypothetical protein